MISGRYRSDFHCRHWTPSNRNGFCLAHTCTGIVGDLVHMLTMCPLLQPTRARLVRFWQERTVGTPVLHNIIHKIIHSPPVVQVQFILNPCSSPPVLAVWGLLNQDHLFHLHYLVRTFAYYLHRAKMISLGRWPGDPGRKQKQPSTNAAVTSQHNIDFSLSGTAVTTLPRADPAWNTNTNQASCNLYRTENLCLRQNTALSNSACPNTIKPYLGLFERSGAAARAHSNHHYQLDAKQGAEDGSIGVVAGEGIGGQ